MITVDVLKDYVGASVSDTAYLTICLNAAVDLVEEFVGTSEVPESILDNAYLQVASELFNRRNAPSGISQFASFDGQAMRVARDPMQSTYPILQKYVVSGV